MTDETTAPWTLDHRVRDLRPSATFTVHQQVAAMRASGHDIFHMGFGESRFPAHPLIVAALQKNAHRNAYLPGQGLLELREAVAGHYSRILGSAFKPTQVIIAPGSKVLLYALLMALQGDLVLPSPSWVTYRPQALLLSKRLIWVPTRLKNHHRLRVPDLRDGVERARREGADPRILMLNLPHNPSGVLYSPDQLRRIAAYARSEGLSIISDEIYGLIHHTEAPYLSVSSYYPAGTILTGGLSKHFSLGGWRLGVGVLPEGAMGAQLMAALVTIASTTWSAASAPIQYAAVVAYDGDPVIESYRKACTRLHALRTRYLWRVLTEAGVECAQPAGAFYLYPCFRPWRRQLASLNILTSEQLASYLLMTQQIASLPGSEFGAPPTDLCLRLATGYLDFEKGDVDGERLLRSFAEADDPESDAFIETHCPRLVEAGRRLVAAIGGWQS